MSDRGGGRARRRDHALWFVVGAVLIAAVVLVVALLVGDGRDAPAATRAPCPHADGRARDLRPCLAESVAYVETPSATGSALLISDGFLVTNAHVVDPFGHVDVVFDGGEEHIDVPVVGVDAATDVAVIGPIETDRPALALGPLADLAEREDSDVFLAGYPGGTEGPDPRLSLSSGILSRTRDETTFDHTYLQTDAAIAGGQSGGALVDDHGRVLGVSGLSFADEFALALSVDDVAAAVQRVLASGGDERRTFPTDDGGTDTRLRTELTAEHPDRLLALPPADDHRTVELVLADGDADVAIDVSTMAGESLGVNAAMEELNAGFEEQNSGADGGWFPTSPDVPRLEEPEPGRYRFEVPAGELAVVYLTRVEDDVAVDLRSDDPFVGFDGIVDGDPIELGTPTRLVIDGLTTNVILPIDLTAGDQVRITVRGGSSDPYFTLLAPGEAFDPLAEPAVDDGAGGLYDTDAEDHVEIDETGRWRLVVGTWDGYIGAFEVTVEAE